MAQTFPLLAVRGIETTTPSFREALVSGALAHGLNPSYVAAVISYESGFNPKAKNPYSGALGLIQWANDGSFDACARKAGMKVRRQDLPSLSAEDQLPLVFAWMGSEPIGETSSPVDYYLSVWGPAFIGKDPATVVGREGDEDNHLGGVGSEPTLGKVYEQNRGFDAEGKGYITLADVAKPVTNVIAQARSRAPLSVPLDPGLPASLQSTIPSPGGAYSSPLPRPPRSPTRLEVGSGATRGSPPSSVSGEPSHDLPILRRGDHGTAVCLLQQLLNLSSTREEPEHELEVDGEYGDSTEAEVALHQIDRRIDPDGVCGPATWASFWKGDTWSLERIGKPVTEEDHG